MRRILVCGVVALVPMVGAAGPFALTYVNPADDPSRRSAGK